MEPLARQLHLLARLVESDRAAAVAAGANVQPAPAAGIADDGLSRFLSRALERTGPPRTAIVSHREGSPVLAASVSLPGGEWLVADIPDLGPPRGGGLALAGWAVLIVIGSTAVALYAASRITRPLRLLEDAAGRIGGDGLLPHIPETGSGEIRATAKALNQLSARLKAAMDSRMRLVAAAGHDLRTPMTRMRLRAEFIADDEEREKWLADLHELDAIADSAIRLVREEAGGEGAETLRLDALLQETVAELKALGYAVTLAAAEPVTVHAGPVALKRALRNLIINAATHGGGATISLAPGGGEAVLTITDEGPGIPQELIGQAFEPFFRIDPARRKTVPGAGLGLAIAREIVERFGGTIAIANRQPHGLAQTVRLPLQS
jgi:signal transduction histidine kinase